MYGNGSVMHYREFYWNDPYGIKSRVRFTYTYEDNTRRISSYQASDGVWMPDVSATGSVWSPYKLAKGA